MLRSEPNHSMFSVTSDRGKVLLMVYVDDIIITGNDHKGIDELKHFLHKKFHPKDFGKIAIFLALRWHDLQRVLVCLR